MEPSRLRGDHFHHFHAPWRCRPLQAGDPWERIASLAAATPRTPLQFMSTAFGYLLETASRNSMALAFKVLGANGFPASCLAGFDE